MAETLQQQLADRRNGSDIAVKYGDQRWTWAEHLSAAESSAAALIAAADRDRPLHVGALLANSPEMLEQMAAAALGGYVLCGLNSTRRGEALAADIRRSDCQLLVTDAVHRHLLAGLELSGVRVVDTSRPRWRNDLNISSGGFEPYRKVDPLDTFMLIFTSGTSGEPKAVQVSHFMVLAAGMSLSQRFSLSEKDTCYIAMPLFHSNAVSAGWGPAVVTGAAMAPAKFSASKFLEQVRGYEATYMNYVGKPLSYILSTPPRPDDHINPLRVAFGNEANESDIAEFATRFDVLVEDGFGSTENAVHIMREPGTPKGSIGRGAPGVAIYSPATVTECPPARFDHEGVLVNPDEAIGELVNTTGGGFFTGYYNDAVASAERLRHGFYWSGDLAYRDGEGWIYFAGRTADWMRIDGENVTTAPIERILLRHSMIRQVAVYAVPDARVGDQVMAAIAIERDIVLRPSDLTEFLSEQPDLSPKCWPRYVRVDAELPMTATHKLLKRQLAAEGPVAGNGCLWVREERGTDYVEMPATATL